MKRVALAVAALACLVAVRSAQTTIAAEMPAWAYPANPPNLQPPVDDGLPKRVPGSTAGYTLKEIANLFATPVWHPEDHPTLTGILLTGRSPGTLPCTYCHYPTGAGKPENASLAGLPEAYILQQMRDFRSGARKSSLPSLLPQQLMVSTVNTISDEETAMAAKYFASLKLKGDWIKVTETDSVPQMTVRGWAWTPVAGSAMQPIGQRIFEVSNDEARTALRDYRSGFTALVPVGSVKKGEDLATTGANGRTMACGICHGPGLKGLGNVPGLVGRSPTYLVRQLYDFQAGTRGGPSAALMKEPVARLTEEDFVSLAAYAASLPVE
jgi:cytochrome c553